MAIVYTGGTFDLFHEGHVELLAACRELAGKDGQVIVSLNTDDFVERYKGKPPVVPYKGRADVLIACKYVDVVVPNMEGEDSRPTIMLIHPDIIAIGDDWAPPRDYHAQMGFTQEWLDENGIKLVYIPRTTGESTSSIKNRIT